MSDDLISRQAAIDAMEQAKEQYFDRRVIIGKMQDVVNNLPPAQSWIPVTERLPKLGEKVLVSTKNTVFTQVFKCIHGTPDRWGWEHNSIKKVIAWMPLPEPYKEDKDDAET